MDRGIQSEMELPAWQRAAADEWINAVTHAIGLLLAGVGALVMVGGVMRQGDVLRGIGCGVYLASLMSVYLMSTLSHSATSPRWKSLFRRLDQGFIYVLIVATYTPFSLAYLSDGRWSMLLVIMWCAAIAGFVAKVFFAHRIEAVSVATYILLGWMPVLAIPALLHSVPAGALWAMLVGGACYTVGTLFLVYDQHVRHFHAVWHLCVIAGSACHFLGILLFVVGGWN